MIVPLYAGELVDELPVEPHDRPVSAALVAATAGYESPHLYWTKAGSMTHHWHSKYRVPRIVPPTEADVPTYQYACTACGHQLEAVQSFSDEPLTACPACEGRLRKLFNSVGVVFKGSGFYRTDSRSESAKSSEKSSSETSSDSSSTKTESTPKKAESTTTTPATTAA